MAGKRKIFATIFCLTANVVGFLLFLMGFFQFTPKLNEKCNLSLKPLSLDEQRLLECKNESYSSPISSDDFRLVLMVVDALRADFVFDNEQNQMPFVRELVSGGQFAVAYRATVQSPTVTMPRIKAMTAGIVPAFVDFLMNFASATFVEDNLLTRMKDAKKPMTFFGDDTWLRLFPDHFKRHDGTTSFVVTDFHEVSTVHLQYLRNVHNNGQYPFIFYVDNNVTRHLADEMSKDDWRLMILHYLGLDHIGHYCGPYCHPLIRPKLLEMNDIVKQLYTQLNKKSSQFVIVLVGDHGMSDSGSHGGASWSETQIPLVFLSPSFKPSKKNDFREVQQIDLTPTLASLLNLSVPRRNLGVLLDPYELLVEDKFSILSEWRRNTLQLLQLFVDDDCSKEPEAEAKNFDYVTNLHKLFAEKYCNSTLPVDLVSAENVLDNYNKLASKLRTKMMSSYDNYDERYLFWGLTTSTMSLVSLTFLVVLLITKLDTNFDVKTFFYSPFVAVAVFHAASFGSTSLIEEEHQTVYFFWSTLTVYLLWRCAKRNVASRAKPICALLLALILHRILREWNRTGDKWRHLSDIGDWLGKMEHVYVLLFLSLLTGFGGFLLMLKRLKSRISKLTFSICIIFAVWCRYRSDWCNLESVWQARLVYCFALLLMLQSWNNFGSAIAAFYSVSLILVKSWNVPLLTIVLLLATILTYSWPFTKLQHWETVVMCYFTMACSYFYLGNSNSIGHIDVASGYVGLTSYNPVLVGMLMTLHMYCCPILVWLLFVHRLSPAENPCDGVSVLCLVKLFATDIYLVLAFALRYHLFIWSVVAPKLLYECFHSTFVCFISILYLFTKLLCGWK